MAIDGIFINKLIIEVKDYLINSRIERINQIEKDIFVFNLYKMGERKYLYFKLNAPNASFFLLDKPLLIENLQSNFLTMLKTNLEGYIISNVAQYGNDRVVEFEVTGNDFLDGKISKNLILELMGRHNNLILVDKDNIIIDAFSKRFNENSRSILPKLPFEYFPNNKLIFNNDYNNIKDPKYLSNTFIGFSPLIAKYLYDNKTNLNFVKLDPTFNLTTNQFYWFNIFNSDDNLIKYNSISDLLSNNISVRQANNNKYLNFVNRELNRYNKLLETLKQQREKANDNLEYRRIGDAIYSSNLNLNNSYSSIKDYNNNEIKIDGSISLNKNAQKYYKLYQKSKRSIEHLNMQINEISNNILIFEQFIFDLSDTEPNYNQISESLITFGFKKAKTNDNKRKKPKITPLTFKYDDAMFYVGKNNIQNEYITHTLAKYNDYWFHIKDQPGSHVVLKGELNDDRLLFGAMLAANYSKEALNPVVTINYTQVKNIKKIPGLKGYNVLLKEFNSINVKVDSKLIKQYLLHTI